MLVPRKSIFKTRVAPEEWDFTRVPSEEYEACCYYEYGRESTFVVQHLENLPHHSCNDPRWADLRNNLLTYSLPPCRIGTQSLNEPWLLKSQDWRTKFCQQLAKHRNGLKFARILERTPDRAFALGIAPPFPVHSWSSEQKRDLDKRTGLEVLIVTIDWSNFEDAEILKEFRRWLKTARPKNIGLRSRRGKKTSMWRKHLEKLAVLRLRHYYPFGEIENVLPGPWNGDKFQDKSEMSRTCKEALSAFHELFPFLDEDDRPVSWQPFMEKIP